MQNLNEDIVFEETESPVPLEIDLDRIERVTANGMDLSVLAAAAAEKAANPTSESELYGLDALPVDKKLAYFA